ncbi:MAG TPA: hypothetical protein VER76_20265, partial [Pyrinomonadaceae bacterium]|nr:hypothetical protein [Pyrinomonadaceae bacterium]
MDSNTFLVIAIIAIVAQSLLLFLALFEPGLNYKIAQPASCPPDSEEFMRIIEALTDAHVTRHSSIEAFTNGENYYEAELEALRRAERNINLEAYIFQKGKVADEFV